MSSRTVSYTDEPIGQPKVIRDFLPAPEDLLLREEDVKVTITLSRKSVDFFKAAAARGDASYQRMIRRLLDAYVELHAKPAAKTAPRGRPRAQAPSSSK